MDAQTSLPDGASLLANYLAGQGLTQTEFAARVGVRQPTISRIVRGRVKPSHNTMIQIERATTGGVPVGAWFPAYHG